MATNPTIVQADAAGPVKPPVFLLMIAIALGVVISVSVVGGAGYYLIRSGKLKLQTMPPVMPGQSLLGKTHAVMLEPLVVNLADASGAAYLRVSIALNVADPVGEPGGVEKSAESKPDKGTNAAVRDTALAVLGRQSSEGLLSADGKERLKKELRDALADRNSEIKVSDLYFTEFLVQR